MKLFAIAVISIIAISATVFAANSHILNPQQLASLSPSGGAIGKYTMPSSPSNIVIKSYADASRPDVSKLAQNCRQQADSGNKNGVITAVSQDAYYNCLSARLKTDPVIE